MQGASDVVNSDAVQNVGTSKKWERKALSRLLIKLKAMFEAQKEQERRLEQQLKIDIVSELALRAAKSEPEKIARENVHVQKITQTQERSSFQCMV